jgi:FkbM family methyltransferase
MIELTFRQRITYLAHLFKAVTRNRFRNLEPLLQKHISADAVVLDIGANVGNFSKIFSRLASKGYVHAFEPSGYARSILKQTVRWRSLDNVTIYPFGLGDKFAREDLRFPIKKKGNVGFGLAHLGDDHTVDSRQTVSESIEIRRLDTVISDQKIPSVSFVKIDIEGWELRALKGGAEILLRDHPTLMLEVNDKFLSRAGDSSEKLWAFLKELGYEIHSLGEDGIVRPAAHPIMFGDILCTHQNVSR